MGAGFFEKARADSETWDLGLARDEGSKLRLDRSEQESGSKAALALVVFSLSPPAAYVVVSLLKLAKLRFPPPSL
jgi:hypothetical protein